MFHISEDDQGVIQLEGRLDALAAPLARDFLAGVSETRRLDFLPDWITSPALAWVCWPPPSAGYWTWTVAWC